MKFVELIDILRSARTLNRFLESNLINTEFDFIDLYIAKEIDTHSKIVLFDIDHTANGASVLIENTCFINFMPLSLILELVVDTQRKKGDIPCLDIAREILNYKIKVA